MEQLSKANETKRDPLYIQIEGCMTQLEERINAFRNILSTMSDGGALSDELESSPTPTPTYCEVMDNAPDRLRFMQKQMDELLGRLQEMIF